MNTDTLIYKAGEKKAITKNKTPVSVVGHFTNFFFFWWLNPEFDMRLPFCKRLFLPPS